MTAAVGAAQHLWDTAKSHQRFLVLEVMGRKAGWVALFTALGAGADWVLVPEESLAPIELMCEKMKNREFGLMVVSEGIEHPDLKRWQGELERVMGAWKDEFGHGRPSYLVGEWVANVIERKIKRETRAVSLGHVQRGGAPTLFDRILATRLGFKAVDLLLEGRHGEIAVIQQGKITSVPLAEAAGRTRTVTKEWMDLVRVFTG